MQDQAPNQSNQKPEQAPKITSLENSEQLLSLFGENFINHFCESQGIVRDTIFTASYLNGAVAGDPVNNEDAVIKKAFKALSSENKVKFMAVIDCVKNGQADAFAVRNATANILFPGYADEKYSVV